MKAEARRAETDVKWESCIPVILKSFNLSIFQLPRMPARRNIMQAGPMTIEWKMFDGKLVRRPVRRNL